MRIVADTNIVVSGLLRRAAPRQLIDAGRERRITLITSPALLAELADVLGRGKFLKPLRQGGLTAERLVADYVGITQLVRPAQVPRVIERDPDDDHVLACALEAQADAIVSGDRHLLDLQPDYRGIAVLTAAQAVERIT